MPCSSLFPSFRAGTGLFRVPGTNVTVLRNLLFGVDLPTQVGNNRDMNKTTPEAWTTAQINIWGDEDSDRFQRNLERAEEAGLQHCQMCGRGVNTAAGKGFSVHAVFGGNDLLAANEWDEFDSYAYGDLGNQFPEVGGKLASGDLGYWLIGPECGKNIPDEFKTKPV